MKLSALFVAGLAACSSRKEPPPRPQPEPPATPPAGSGSSRPSTTKYDALARPDFNRWAVRENLPVYWIADTNNDKSLQPDEVASLLFYPTEGTWVAQGAFTKDFDAAYAQIVAA